jgi:flagellar hook-length control protein FliK
MSLILPSTTAPAPAPSANPATHSTTRFNEQDQSKPESFGEALARSLEPAGEKTEKPAVKTANLAPARRPAGHQKPDTDDLVNAMALPFTPIEIRMAKTALPGGAGAATDSALPGTAAALLTSSDSALPGTAAALPNDLLAGKPVTTGESTNADAQSALVSVLAAASPKNAGQTPLQATDAPVTEGAVIQIDPPAIAGQAKAANTGFSGQLSKRDGKDADVLSESSDARADLARVSPHGSKKVAANPAAQTPETAASPIASSPAGTDATVSSSSSISISAALPVNPATAAAVQTPGGVAASNAPNSITTATLVPEVGNNEWGKALGQQVTQMGHAGHQLAELQLNPPGLGPLKVTLSMNDHQMQAMFVSAHSSVRAAVEAALPQLRATLAESGISLGHTSVGAESQQQQQTAFTNGQGGQPERGTYQPAWMADTAALLPARTVTEPARRNNGMRIDTYA